MSQLGSILTSHLTITDPTKREENFESLLMRFLRLSLSTSYGRLHSLAQDEFTYNSIEKFSAATFGRT